jgi:mannosyltransferase OCH1-like enzyme
MNDELKEEESSMIPKIIHLTWKSKKIPKKYRSYLKSIIRFHANWDIKIWTDRSMYQLVIENYPKYQKPYNSYSNMIQRCDFFRLLVVYHFGGVYLDLDMQIIKSLNELDESIEIFFPCEKIMDQESLIRHNNRDSVRIGNYAFGSIPKHPFLEYLLDKFILPQFKDRPILSEDDILESTGPGIITTAYHDYISNNANNKVVILYPKENNDPHCGCGFFQIAPCKLGDFGNHYHLGIWRGVN